MKLLEIKDIKTYDPSEMRDDQLADDFRIISGWFATWKIKGREFKYSRKEIIDTTVKIIKEIIKRGKITFHPENWTASAKQLYTLALRKISKQGIAVPKEVQYLVEELQFKPEEWTPEFLEKLDDAQLLEKLSSIKEIFVARGSDPQDEAVVNAYILLIDEIEKRKLEYSVVTELQELADRLTEGAFDDYVMGIKNEIDKIGNIILAPNYVSWTGSTLYAKNRLPNDLDIVIRDKEFSYHKNLKLSRLIKKLTGVDPCIHLSIEGPNWRHFPLYHLALVPVKANGFIEVGYEEPGFASLLYEQRAAPPEIRKQAETSRKEDKIKQGRFFLGMKPTRAARPNKRMTIDYFLSLFKDEDFPVLSSKKMDGMRVIIFRDGDKIEVWSEDGENVTQRLPKTIDALSKINGRDYIIDAELEMWVGDKHQPREAVAGYVHAKTEPDDSDLVLNIFTVLYHNGIDLHKKPESERQDILKKFGIPQSTMSIPDTDLKLNLIPNLISENKSELEEHTRRVWKQPASEGNVAKKTNSVYYLDGNAREGWIKWHANALLYGRVIKRNPTKVETVFNYDYGILPGTYKFRDEDLVEVEGKKYVKVGTTFNTDEKKNRGELIAVEFETFNLIDNKKKQTTEVTAWAPRYIYLEETEEPIPKEANTINDIVTKASRNRVLQRKTITPERKTLYECRHATWEDIDDCKDWQEFREVIEQINPELPEISKQILEEYELEQEKPSTEFTEDIQEEKRELAQYPKNYAILVNHFRGKSVHLDFRRKQNGSLEGETILNAPEGLITEEVDTITKGREWNTELLKKGKFRPDMNPNKKAVLVGKATQPLVWLNVREVSYPPGSVGATKFEWGTFITMDEGFAYPGVQRPYFKEFFLDMKKFKKQRMVERLLGVPPEWEKKPKAPLQWQAWTNMKDETPYILSKRQRKDKRDYVPKDGEKAIPPWWEEKIKPEYRWWVKDLTKSEKIKRLDLAFNDLIEQGVLKHIPIKIKEEALQEKKGKFTLRFLWWMGPKVVRELPATDSRFQLLIDTGKKALDRWDFSGKFYGDPTKQAETPSTRKTMNIQTPNGEPFQKWLEWEGSIAARDSKLTKTKIIDKSAEIENAWVVGKPMVAEIVTKPTFAKFKKGQEVWIDQWKNIYTGNRGGAPYGNPNERLPAYVDIKDTGSVEWIEDTDLFSSFKFDGKLLKGLWVMRREDIKSDIWIFSKGRMPGQPREDLSETITESHETSTELSYYFTESPNHITFTVKGQEFDVSTSDFPMEISFDNSNYKLIKTKNDKLILNKN